MYLYLIYACHEQHLNTKTVDVLAEAPESPKYKMMIPESFIYVPIGPLLERIVRDQLICFELLSIHDNLV